MHKATLLLAVAAVASVATAAPVPLAAKSYEKLRATHSVVVVHVNWGRYWKCGPYENAQLQRLAFRRLPEVGAPSVTEDWELKVPNRLTAKPFFQPYAYLVEPGTYALSGLRLKVAASTSDVRVADLDSTVLLPEGAPAGGTFTIGTGEVVYIGHFGLDCKGEPTPWRFYIEGKDEFQKYSKGFQKQFPFTNETPPVFRLFKTDKFGSAYELAP
jgi:hypothetical protein